MRASKQPLFLTFALLSYRIVANLDPPVCPVSVAYNNETRLDSADPVRSFDEISGLAASPNQVSPSSGWPVLYGVNDSKGGQRLGVWDSKTGERLLSLVVPRVTKVDWEAMAIGSCGSSGVDETCIYIADAGDNRGRSSGGTESQRNGEPYRIIKIKEPDLQKFADGDTIPESYLSVLPFDYTDPSSPTLYADCEAIFLDHKGWGDGGEVGDIYLITKWAFSQRRLTRVFKIPASAWPSELNGSVGNLHSSKTVGNYGSSSALAISHLWTRASMSYDGTVIAVGNEKKNFLFLRCPGATIAEVLTTTSAQSCHQWRNPSVGQVESFAWMPDGLSNIQLPEALNPRIGLTQMAYDTALTSQECPRVAYIQGQCRSLEDDSLLPRAWCDEALAALTAAPSNLPSTTNPSPAPPTPPTLPQAKTRAPQVFQITRAYGGGEEGRGGGGGSANTRDNIPRYGVERRFLRVDND